METQIVGGANGSEVRTLVSDMYLLVWISGTIFLAGGVSLLKWLNTPMPARTWGRGLLVYMNGVTLAILTTLWLGDKVFTHEVSLLHFTFYVLVAALGGAHLFDFFMSRIMRIFTSDSKKGESS